MVTSNDFCTDSTEILLDVFVLESPELTHTGLQICEGDHEWRSDKDIYSTNSSTLTSSEGEYSLQVMNESCASNIDSVLLIQIDLPSEPALEFTEGVLYATAIQGVDYHWYVNGTEVAVIDLNFYIPTISGDYRVAVETEFDCQTYSELLFVSGINEPVSIDERINFYPNPMNESGTLELGLNKYDSMQILDVNGKVIQEIRNLEFLPKVIIHRSIMDSGSYIINLKKKDGSYETLKFIVE